MECLYDLHICFRRLFEYVPFTIIYHVFKTQKFSYFDYISVFSLSLCNCFYFLSINEYCKYIYEFILYLLYYSTMALEGIDLVLMFQVIILNMQMHFSGHKSITFFFLERQYIKVKLVTPGLCNNIMSRASRDIKDAHYQKLKIKSIKKSIT